VKVTFIIASALATLIAVALACSSKAKVDPPEVIPEASPARAEPALAEDPPVDPELRRAQRLIDSIEARMRRCHYFPETCVRP